MKKTLLFLFALLLTSTIASAQTYTVTGNPAIHNTGSNWGTGDEANNLTFSGKNNQYTLLVQNKTLTAGNYEFKIIKNHKWDGSDGGSWPSNNYVLNIPSDGTYNILYVFYSDSGSIFVTTSLADHYYMKHPWGGGNNWYWKQLTKGEDGKFYYVYAQYGGSGVNLNPYVASDDLHSTYVKPEDIELQGNPNIGDDCTFIYNVNMNVVRIVKGIVTNIDDVKVEGTSTYKTIENGQVVIVRDGVRYNTLGVKL